MEVTAHLIFEMIKIAVLSTFYSLIILIIFKLFRKNTIRGFKKIWFKVGMIIYILLFVFMFTHWGNHGFGDSARIPLKNGLALENINWNAVAYIEEIKTENESTLETTKFLIANNQLLGNLESDFYDYSNKYFVLDLKTKKLTEFKNQKSFDIYLNKNTSSGHNNLLSFEDNYHKYWDGWKFWLLP